MLCPFGIIICSNYAMNLSFMYFFVNCIVLEHVSARVLARAFNNNSAPKPVCECGSAVVILTYMRASFS